MYLLFISDELIQYLLQRLQKKKKNKKYSLRKLKINLGIDKGNIGNLESMWKSNRNIVGST